MRDQIVVVGPGEGLPSPEFVVFPKKLKNDLNDSWSFELVIEKSIKLSSSIDSALNWLLLLLAFWQGVYLL